MPERRLIVDVFDPAKPVPGGVDTCIRGLAKYCPPSITLHIAGVAEPGEALGDWITQTVEGRPVNFLAVATANPSEIRPRVPHVLKMAIGILRYRKQLRPFDVYQCHRPAMGYIVRRIFRSSRHVQFLHNDGIRNLQAASESYFKRVVFLYRRLERSAVQACSDVVVFNSDGARRLASMSTAENVRFSPTWFDDDYFFPDPEPSTQSSSGVLRVLTVGRLDPSKDPVLAVAAVASYGPDCCLTMVGSGSMAQEIGRHVASRGMTERVVLAGAVPKSEVADYMRSSDVLLMTSHYEGYPRTVVEALACGLPVVTTDGGEPNGLVVDGINGVRVAERSGPALAEGLHAVRGIARSQCAASVKGLTAHQRVMFALDAYSTGA